MKKRALRVVLGVVAGLTVITAVTFATGMAMADAGGWHAKRVAFFKKMIDTRIDSALDGAQATADQRQRIHTAKADIIAVIEQNHQQKGAMLEEALTLFEGANLDAVKVAQLRAEHEARSRQIGDVIVRSIRDAHDTLSPVQRKAITDYIRKQLPANH